MACSKFNPRMLERVQRFRRLNSRARGLFVRAALLLPILSLSLRLRGFRKTQALLQKHLSAAPGPPNSSSLPKSWELTSRMVRAAVRHGLGHPTCLSESLALWWLLGRQGIPSELRVGVRKSGEKFEAHAWVECDGVPINEPEALHQRYFAFDSALASLPPELQ